MARSFVQVVRWCVALPLLAGLALPSSALALLTAGGDYRGTDHTDHDHSNQVLTGVDLSPIPATALAPAVPSIIAEADFSGTVLDFANLREIVAGCKDDNIVPKIDCTTFLGASAVSAVLGGALLASVVFDSADLTGADLTGADLTEATAVGVILDGANLSGSTWIDADLSGADLRFVDAVAPDLSGANLTNATLIWADLLRAVLVGVDLTGADARSADLEASDLTGIDATGANFDSASLRGVVLVDTVLHGVDFTLADLTNVDARCTGASEDPPVDPPAIDSCSEFDGAQLLRAHLVDGSFQYAHFVDRAGVATNLSSSELTRADFSDSCFTAWVSDACVAAAQTPAAGLAGATLSGTRFDRAIMEGVDLSNASGACMAARPGDPDPSQRCPSFIETDLAGADLGRARILGGVFTGTGLRAADLRNAVLNEMTSPCTVPSVEGEPIRCLELFVPAPGPPGPLARLDGVRLIDADIAGISFENVGMTGADLSDADAYKVRTVPISLVESFDVVYQTSFRGATLVDAVLVSADFEQADFSNALLTRADFSASVLTGVDLMNADLTDVNFSRAILRDADLTAADLQGVQFADGATTQTDNGDVLCTLAPGGVSVDLRGATLDAAQLSGAKHFYEGCIQVDLTTTYDGGTTSFPIGFTLRPQMTNVPEPTLVVARVVALGALAGLARVRRRAAR